jgi:hypothetical protein
MKQKIYTVGLATLILVFLGGISKINHWPGAGIMLTIGMLIFIFAFLPLALMNNYKAEGNRQNLSLYIVTWITCLVVFGSMLFKIQHWPGAGKLLIIAIPFPYVVFLPVFLAVTGRNKSFNIYNTVFVLFLLSGISVFSVLLSLNVSKEKINDSLQLSRNYNRIETVMDKIPQPVAETGIARKMDELIATVNDYQSVIFAREGITAQQWDNDPWSYPMLDATDVASGVLVTDGEERPSDMRLQSQLQSLISELKSTTGYEDLAKAFPVIVEFTELQGASDEWTRQMFIWNTRAWSLIYLDGLETNLKLLRATVK